MAALSSQGHTEFGITKRVDASGPKVMGGAAQAMSKFSDHPRVYVLLSSNRIWPMNQKQTCLHTALLGTTEIKFGFWMEHWTAHQIPQSPSLIASGMKRNGLLSNHSGYPTLLLVTKGKTTLASRPSGVGGILTKHQHVTSMLCAMVASHLGQ